MMRLLFFFLLLATALPTFAARQRPETPEAIAKQILAPLLDPVKVATLKGDRPANQRLYKILHWLEVARQRGGDVPAIMDIAQAAAGYEGTPEAKADKQAVIWSRAKLEEFGCFTEAGLDELRHGGSPTITQGPHTGEDIALDHVLPRSIVPELAGKFFNLEAITAKANRSKSAKITTREVELARRWNRDVLLSADGLAAIEAARK
jgi:hypothetical protein